MKKIIIVCGWLALSGAAHADCVALAKDYQWCNAGYYLLTNIAGVGVCTRCPSSGGVYGTSIDGNAAGIESCYIPTGTTSSDDSGDFEYTNDCFYQQ